MSVLRDGLDALGFGGGSFCGMPTRPLAELADAMEAYIRVLQEHNARFDLVNADGHDEIAARHVLDSLSALPALCRELSARTAGGLLVADIGSGAGLPGIPLAAALPGVPFVLVERMAKRCGFLRHAAGALSLANVSVEENQVERLEQNRFDAVVFRAFRPLDKKMTKVLLRILKDGGILAAYKAKKEKIAEEMAAIPQRPEYAVIPLTVPFLTENTESGEARERNLVVIKKRWTFAQNGV